MKFVPAAVVEKVQKRKKALSDYFRDSQIGESIFDIPNELIIKQVDNRLSFAIRIPPFRFFGLGLLLLRQFLVTLTVITQCQFYSPNISDIDATQLFEVKAFKEKVRDAGCLYWDYDGQEEFANYLRKHLIQYLSRMYGPHSETEKSIRIATLLEERFNKSLKMYEDQPNIWIEPVLYEGDLSMDPDEAYDNKIPIDSLIDNPQSYNVIAPPLFGLSSLSHYLVLKAWKAGAIWARVDISAIKLRHVNKAIQNYLGELGGDFKISNVQCIVLDQFKENDKEALKKLKAFTEEYKSIPIIVMRTKDDVQIMKEEPELISIDRSFKTLHLVAMTRHQIRDLVSQYNKDNRFEDEDILVSKLVSDLEVLNIHRTAYNCLTLLKVDEHHFDETPVNRTRMLDMVLMVLFDYGKVPQYRSKPDVKDWELTYQFKVEHLQLWLVDFSIIFVNQ